MIVDFAWSHLEVGAKSPQLLPQAHLLTLVVNNLIAKNQCEKHKKASLICDFLC